jgi:methionyl-tRNA synthetase
LDAIGEALPKKIFAHGFFTVNGQKISKSLGNAIDPVELVNEYGADAIRYFLLRDIPFGNDGDFSRERLKDRYNADLANGLGNLVSRVLNMVEQFAPELAPPYEGGVARSKAEPGWLQSVDTHLESLAFDKALAVIWEAIAKADQLIEEKKPWQLAKRAGNVKEAHEELEGVLAQLYNTLVAINDQIAPFMPAIHKKLNALLNARPLKKPIEPLFARKE